MGNKGMVKESTEPTRVKTLRSRFRRGVEDGTGTWGDKAKGNKVVGLLNEALAIEICCILRYTRHYFMAAGLSSFNTKTEFLRHAMEEQVYADPLAERIVQLGGEPNLSPENFLKQSHPEFVEEESLREMIMEDLHAQQTTINSYRELLASIGTDDPASYTILENILMQKEEQATNRGSLLKILGPESKSLTRCVNRAGKEG